jgi:HSP20 family protein
MSIRFYETPFDILVKNFFEADSKFFPASETKSPHPVDIYENKNGLHFEVACTGLSKEDIEINIEGDILKVSYQKTENKSYDLDEHNYIQKGIARRSFNLGYKIASRFNLSEANAEMKNGLLVISIPLSEEAKPKSLKIK